VSLDVAGLAVAMLAIVVSAVAYRAAVFQNRLTASSVAADWLRDLRSWASEAIDVLAEATYTCRCGDPAPSESGTACLLRCRHRLSALIDRGRLLLPNEREGEYGGHKARAYRGLRHPALDALVAAELVLEDALPLHAFPDRRAALIGLRREFVSMVQAIIDPQTYNKDVARLLRLASAARAKDPTLGGLLPDAKKVPTGAEGMMATASRRYKVNS
jgi:hypothetical protein